MTDVLTIEQRRRNMQAIKGKDSEIELQVRKFLHSRGFRFRLHDKGLPGRPDVVLKKYNTVVFINGCYWHQHENCDLSTMPKSRSEFWKDKLTKNKERDQRNLKKLKELGWNVIVLWECDIERKTATILTELETQLLKKK
jgi:DNA mismatch endonuclease (patch repair protein)